MINQILIPLFLIIKKSVEKNLENITKNQILFLK